MAKRSRLTAVQFSTQKKRCAPACAHTTWVVCAHHRHSKMALCATGSSMAGEVTAPKCYHQAKVFHELNTHNIELLQDVFAFYSRPIYANPILGPRSSVANDQKQFLPASFVAGRVTASADGHRWSRRSDRLPLWEYTHSEKESRSRPRLSGSSAINAASGSTSGTVASSTHFSLHWGETRRIDEGVVHNRCSISVLVASLFAFSLSEALTGHFINLISAAQG